MKEKDDKEKKEFEYIHEVVGDKRRSMKWLLKIIIIAMIGGSLIGMAVSVTVSDYIPGLLSYTETKEEYRSILENNTTGSTNEELDSHREDVTDVHKGNESDVTQVAEGIEMAKLAVVPVTVIDENEKRDNLSKKYEAAVCVFASHKILIFITDGSNIYEGDKISIRLNDGKDYDAYIREKDEITGVAAIAVDGFKVPEEVRKDIKIPTIDLNRRLQKEDKAVIIGTPYEQKESVLEGTVKDMDLSVKKTDGVYQSYVTDITIQDSINGFMFSESGSLEAIILRDMQEEDTAGIITAVPISEIKTRVQDICNGSPAVYLGIDGDDITDEVKQQVDPNMPYGVYIKQCVPDSPAYRSGILAGDIIISINNESIKNMRDIKIALDNCEAGKEINVVVMRNGRGEYKEIKYVIELDK